MSWRLQRVPTIPTGRSILSRIVSIVAALMVGGVVLSMLGNNPFALGFRVIDATFGSSYGLEDLGLLATSLILTGLAVAVPLRIGIWNIGAEGQFYMGALAATAVGIFIDGPAPLMLAAMFGAGLAGGMVWILVPTLARAYANVNEIITTLLLNFVAILLVFYVATGPWRDRGAAVISSTPRIPYEVPELYGNLHIGIVFAVASAVMLSLVFRHTRWGYEVYFSGANPRAAHYAGMPVKRRIIAAMLISGAIAGAAGMLELAGTVHRLQGGISNNFGYLGIIVAILAGGSPLGVIVTGLVMAVILNSGVVLRTQGVSTEAVLALTGLILIFAAVGERLAHYRIIPTGAHSEK